MATQRLALLLFALLAVYILRSKYEKHAGARRFKKEKGCLPPVRIPQNERIIGYSLFMNMYRGSNEHRLLRLFQDAHKCGDTFTGTLLGSSVIMTIDPENVKTVLATAFDDFGVGPREKILGPLAGKGIFTSDGAAWQHSRALIRPAFTKAQVADLDFYEPHVEKLIRCIPPDGSTVDLAPLFVRLTLDSAMEFLLGAMLDPLHPQEGIKRHEFGVAFDYAQDRVGHLAVQGFLRHAPWNRKFRESCKAVHAFVDEFVRRAQTEQETQSAVGKDQMEKSGRYVFLDELVRSTNDPDRIRDELVNILIAGRDTTAALLTHTFHAISKRPDIWAKLREDVQSLKGLPPSYEDLKSMKYLKQVIDESLRLYPIVAQDARFANTNTCLPHGGGPDGSSPMFVAAGQVVSYNVYAMHRNPAIYGADAEEFKPERWDTMRQGWHYLPFNGGPRICPGQQFALTEASYIIVRLLQRFGRLESRDDQPWIEKLSLTATSLNGAKVAMVA